jgi:hypothetical protein
MNAHRDAPRYDDKELAFEKRAYDGGPYRHDFEQCNYCGSMHPHALLEALRAGAVLDMADWKYGWPHKFYVEGIPNPVAGELCRSTSTMGTVRNGKSMDFADNGELIERDATPEELSTGRYQSYRKNEKAPAQLHAKFYSEHMVDAGDDFNELALRIAALTGVTFQLRDERLFWQCARRH